jgi:signal transduction histidine kinase
MDPLRSAICSAIALTAFCSGVSDPALRYDDRLDTILSIPDGEKGARAAIWGQIVDLLAQSGGRLTSQRSADLVDQLERWRQDIPEMRRVSVAKSLAGMRVPRELVAFFGQDRASVAAPVLSGAVLDADDWPAVIAVLPPSSRALLRRRHDLPQTATAALERFGLADFALPAAQPVSEPVVALTTNIVAPKPAPQMVDPVPDTAIQISELVARIEAYRQAHPWVPDQSDLRLPLPESCDTFRFEARADGLIHWVEGAPREPLIGLSLADMADARASGVDGHAAGAFRQRNRFRDARLLIIGSGPVSGNWLISANPVFDTESGRFLGYRGTARRPLAEEQVDRARLSVFGPDLQPDSVRQLVHELRTPLNAIRGFAEMIQGQLLGPVMEPYRERSTRIATEVEHMLQIFDDLDSAARMESGAVVGFSQGVATPCTPILQRLANDLRGLAARRNISISMVANDAYCRVSADPVTVERMFSRLLVAVAGHANPDELLQTTLDLIDDDVTFAVPMPKALAHLSDAELLDPAFSPMGDWPDAPALGLGFSLRLIGGMAESVGGRFVIADGRFTLILPAATDTAGEHQGRG